MAPSSQTIKKLFALSGNRCAFPNCRSQLVCEGVVIGQICHIKAASPEGPRYDQRQREEERHGFDNLILLCANHHKVIDDDTESYTVERLLKMKADHEASSDRIPEDDAAKGATLLLSMNQSGGITAHSVHAHTIHVHSPGSHLDQKLARREIISRARKLHKERIEIIRAKAGPISLMDGAALAIHVVPFSAFDEGATPPFDMVSKNPRMFPPEGGRVSDFRISFDGLVTGSNGDGLSKPQRAYVQVFRSGVVESVVTSLSRGKEHNCLVLPQIQAVIIAYSRLYAASLDACGIAPPFVVCVSLMRANGMRLVQDFLDKLFWFDAPFGSLNSDALYFGEVVFDSVPVDNNTSAKLLKAILDHIANASWLASSPYFDSDGNYTLRFAV